MSYMRHMGAYLVRSSRDEIDLKQSLVASALEDTICRDYLLSAREFRISYLNYILCAILSQPTVQGIRPSLRRSVNQTKVAFSYLVISYLLVHHAKRLGILCRDNDTARVAVYPVAERGSKGIFSFGIILARRGKICLYVHYKRVLLSVGVLVNEHSGALVEKHNILVLVNYIKLRLDARERARVVLRRIKKLISDKELYLVTLAEKIILLDSLAVYLYLFSSYVFIHKRLRQSLDSLREEFIKPLPRVVAVYL